MKLILSTIVSLLTSGALLASAAQGTQPSAVKFAFVNTTAILQGTAEGKKELAALEAYVSERQKALDSEQSKLQELRRQFDSQSRMLNPDTAAEMQRSITEKDRTVRRTQEDMELDVNRRRNELLSRMSEKIQVVIAEFAEANGYGAVFMETPTLPYFAPTLDITSEIVRLYDQKNPVASAGPAAPAPGTATGQNP
jgi:outer membrane protein